MKVSVHLFGYLAEQVKRNKFRNSLFRNSKLKLSKQLFRNKTKAKNGSQKQDKPLISLEKIDYGD